MNHYHQDFDNLGRNIQELVDRAVSARDYQQLNQSIRQMVGRAVDVGGEAVRKAADSIPRPMGQQYSQPMGQQPFSRPTGQPVQRPAAQPVQRPVVQQAPRQNLPALYANTGGYTTAAVFKIIGGGAMCGVSMLLMMGSALLNAVGISLGVFPLIPALGMVGVGGFLLATGIRTTVRLGRFKKYRKTLGQSTSCTLEKLARSVGKSEKFVHKDVTRMIGEGLFLEGHLDREETTLITSNETFRQFEQSRLQLEERQRKQLADRQAAAARQTAIARDPRLQEVLDRGNAFLAEIRRCNDEIPGAEISAKIDRMEDIVRRIFRRAEGHPEIVPDLKKMMDYYLPMTVKLLNAYADMDAQTIQGENILSSKREIEATLDTLNLAFEKLLDDLFMDTAMDVSSDISVLNTLLAQEGLTEDDLTRMKKQQGL